MRHRRPSRPALICAAALSGLLAAGAGPWPWERPGQGARAQAATAGAIEAGPPALLEKGGPDPRAARVVRLRRQLEDILHEPLVRGARVGVVVLDGQSGEELFSHAADAAYNPASNTKILTTAAALSTLGPDYRFHTWLLGPPAKAGVSEDDGVVHGDVFVQGSGDPSLTPTGLADLARSLARRGVRRIEGDVRVDSLFRDRKALEETAAPLSFGPGALLIDRDVYRVHIHAGTAGKGASAWVEPRSSYFVLRNLVRTTRGKKARVLIDHGRSGEHLVVTIRGRIGDRHAALSIKKRMADSSAWAALTLRQALSDFGIEVRGQVRVGPPPPGPLQVLAEHASLPLSEICRVVNKDSNNFVAEIVFKALGASRFGFPGTLEKGARAVGEWLTAFGLPSERVHIVNGSGLTHENRLRPADLARLLLGLYHDPALGPEFIQSLAVGGIDGTIRGRFHGALSGAVRGKTGTLDGVSVLSGYVGARAAGTLIFSVFMEGFRKRRLETMRHTQARIVGVLMQLLNGDVPVPVPVGIPMAVAPGLGGDGAPAVPAPGAEGSPAAATPVPGSSGAAPAPPAPGDAPEVSGGDGDSEIESDGG